jgi:hypothetical protein
VHFIRGGGLFGGTLPRVDNRTGSIVQAIVAIAADVSGDMLNKRIVTYLTALHELGHALGLAHTNDVRDIMFSFRAPDDGQRYFKAYRDRLRTPEDVGTAVAPGLSAEDISALQALYDRQP